MLFTYEQNITTAAKYVQKSYKVLSKLRFWNFFPVINFNSFFLFLLLSFYSILPLSQINKANKMNSKNNCKNNNAKKAILHFCQMSIASLYTSTCRCLTSFFNTASVLCFRGAADLCEVSFRDIVLDICMSTNSAGMLIWSAHHSELTTSMQLLQFIYY